MGIILFVMVDRLIHSGWLVGDLTLRIVAVQAVETLDKAPFLAALGFIPKMNPPKIWRGGFIVSISIWHHCLFAFIFQWMIDDSFTWLTIWLVNRGEKITVQRQPGQCKSFHFGFV